jgi:hypothetical protein
VYPSGYHTKKEHTLTYRSDFTLPSEILEHISERGFDFLPKLIRIIINGTMQAERQQSCKLHLTNIHPIVEDTPRLQTEDDQITDG